MKVSFCFGQIKPIHSWMSDQPCLHLLVVFKVIWRIRIDTENQKSQSGLKANVYDVLQACAQVTIDWFFIRLRCDTEDFTVSPIGFRKPKKLEPGIPGKFCLHVESRILGFGIRNIFIFILPFKLDICIKFKKKMKQGRPREPMIYWHRQELSTDNFFTT